MWKFRICPYKLKTAWTVCLWCGKGQYLKFWCLVNTITCSSFSVGRIYGVKYDLVLVTRSHFFEYCRQTFYRHTLKHCKTARQMKLAKTKIVCFYGTPEYYGHVRSPMVGRDTLSPLAPTLGPYQMYLSHGGQIDTK